MSKTILKPIALLIFITMILTACVSATTPQATIEAPILPTTPATEPPPQALPTGEPTLPPLPAPTLEPIKLKVLVLPYLAYAPFFIAEEEGFYAEQGLEVEIVRMDKSGEFTSALINGELDVVADQYNVGVLNAIAKGSKIRYVADKGFFDPEGCTYICWAVGKDLLESGKLEDLRNLAGMKVAASTATSIEYFFDMMGKEVGLTSEDAELVNLPPPDRLEGLKTGAIDIANISEPWILRLQKAGVGEVWRPMEKEFPNFTFSLVMYGPNLLEKNPEAGKRFMVAYMKAVWVYNEGKTDRNVEIMSKYTQLDPEEIKQSCWQPIKSDGMVNLQSLFDFQEWAVAKGYQDIVVTEEQLWDASFVEYALDQLK